MDEATFDKLADATLKALMAEIEDGVADGIEDIDLQGSVLTIELEDGGTYVINKHAANKEIWLSSPKSGAAHYAFDPASGRWQPTRGGADLHAVLSAEFSAIAGAAVELAPVAPGSRG
ncbi:frataxin [Dongia mobilis]|uniref:Iron-sulfur cluster assembly protein CyaY n=1 Tax=Dongia mobilis TaxID=578943 RepID=A0A4R6WRK3_9PROT|nr:iron donor protein CyaY [Dongia mobilis]TDQ84225.1 frataxin [Dongia mobilis]